MTFHDTDTTTSTTAAPRPSAGARLRAVLGEMRYANKRLLELQTTIVREPRA